MSKILAWASNILSIASFTISLIEKNCPFFSFIYQINSNKPTYNKPIFGINITLSTENFKLFLIKSEGPEPLFAERSKLIFCQNLNNAFPLRKF